MCECECVCKCECGVFQAHHSPAAEPLKQLHSSTYRTYNHWYGSVRFGSVWSGMVQLDRMRYGLWFSCWPGNKRLTGFDFDDFSWS